MSTYEKVWNSFYSCQPKYCEYTFCSYLYACSEFCFRKPFEIQNAKKRWHISQQTNEGMNKRTRYNFLSSDRRFILNPGGCGRHHKRNVGPEVCAWCEGCVSPCRLGSFWSQQVDITRVYLKTVFFVPIELLFSTGHARWTSHIRFNIFCALNLFPINGYYFPYNSFCGCRPSRTLLWLDKQVHIKRWRHQQEACDVKS